MRGGSSSLSNIEGFFSVTGGSNGRNSGFEALGSIKGLESSDESIRGLIGATLLKGFSGLRSGAITLLSDLTLYVLVVMSGLVLYIC